MFPLATVLIRFTEVPVESVPRTVMLLDEAGNGIQTAPFCTSTFEIRDEPRFSWLSPNSSSCGSVPPRSSTERLESYYVRSSEDCPRTPPDPFILSTSAKTVLGKQRPETGPRLAD